MSRNDGILTHFIVKGCQKERWHDFTMISHYSTICYYHFFVHLQRIKKKENEETEHSIINNNTLLGM